MGIVNFMSKTLVMICLLFVGRPCFIFEGTVNHSYSLRLDDLCPVGHIQNICHVFTVFMGDMFVTFNSMRGRNW